MNRYVVCIQVPDILGKIYKEIGNDNEELKELSDLLEEFENETEYAGLYLNGDLMLGFNAPSEKSAKSLYKFVKRIFIETAEKYELSFELCSVLEDNTLNSILYEES